MNSTPHRPTSTIRFTALLPPPPTPTTFILAPRRASGSSVSRSLSSSLMYGLQSFTVLTAGFSIHIHVRFLGRPCSSDAPVPPNLNTNQAARTEKRERH